MPLADVGQELAVGWVGRFRRSDQRSQGGGIRRLLGLIQMGTLGVFAQAGAVLCAVRSTARASEWSKCHLSATSIASGAARAAAWLKVLHRSRQITLTGPSD
ncbi:hypothetical protein ABZ471_38995 [Streptomyces sp. NPDC005728]|uniref:hypothetical protein n=1 Tax=Streptomyces sp. NPDC005728 TaxID=3157054 RepID=UPI0033F3C373